MSNKCGMYELILSAFRSFVGGHDIWGCWFFIVPFNSFATWKTLSSLSDFELVNFNKKFSSKFSIMTFCISKEMVYTRTFLCWQETNCSSWNILFWHFSHEVFAMRVWNTDAQFFLPRQKIVSWFLWTPFPWICNQIYKLHHTQVAGHIVIIRTFILSSVTSIVLNTYKRLIARRVVLCFTTSD